jgi:hypothetical protein
MDTWRDLRWIPLFMRFCGCPRGVRGGDRGVHSLPVEAVLSPATAEPAPAGPFRVSSGGPQGSRTDSGHQKGDPEEGPKAPFSRSEEYTSFSLENKGFTFSLACARVRTRIDSHREHIIDVLIERVGYALLRTTDPSYARYVLLGETPVSGAVLARVRVSLRGRDPCQTEPANVCASAMERIDSAGLEAAANLDLLDWLRTKCDAYVFDAVAHLPRQAMGALRVEAVFGRQKLVDGSDTTATCGSRSRTMGDSRSQGSA